MAAQTNAALPNGLEFAGYRIVKKIASGGFSIVYLAQDADGNACVLKEYLPSTLVRRAAGERVPTIAPEHLAVFRMGLKCFFEEGRALVSIAHPQVVSVLNFFRAHDTVYMVMDYVAGRSLQDYVLDRSAKNMRRLVSERFLRNVFERVMDGLREVHTHKLLHLDLKPANIYLRTGGGPMLLDFGAARQALLPGLARFYPMYTPGFAAPELYGKHGKLGPWTDIYGLGATLYSCMAGAPPQPADLRLQNDLMAERLKKLAPLYSDELIAVVRWSLQLDVAARPQSVFALQKALRDTAPAPGSMHWRRRFALFYLQLQRLASTPISLARLAK